ncbi:DEAD/DEAH box helicase [Deferrisoma palaeochoriense]
MASDRDIVRPLGAVGHAFFGRFNTLRAIQRQAIPPILKGRNALVTSATASGKTEAVFAPLVARLKADPNGSEGRIRILAVAPTRALVNDLFARLEGPLAKVGWTCGRQTSDHRDKARRPHVLITTPESFDSMLVRDSVWKDGGLVDHILAGVQAVFLDEAHLFDSSPRGDQVVWLLARLRRVREFARAKGWVKESGVQVCGASATVSHPEDLARKLLGESAEVVAVPGSREIEILSAQTGGWVPLDPVADPVAIHPHLLHVRGADDLDAIGHWVWQALGGGHDNGCRKVLVFVPSRALCDKLTLVLGKLLRERREIFVGAHHGSLERNRREYAEREFSRARDAVLVATTTLEVGIDIGDVDAVTLVGAPSNTASLLQRIGRSGRRTGWVRVIPVVRSGVESRALASMLDNACHGALDPVPRTRLWSVFVQQAISYVAQAGRRGRRREDLLALAEEVWPESEGAGTAAKILETLIETGALIEQFGRLHLGEEWANRCERAGGDVHHNFSAGDRGIPVVDGGTGEVIAYVQQGVNGSGTVALAGQRWKVVSQEGEIVLRTVAGGCQDETFRYASRSAPMGKAFAEHVRRGLGLKTTDAPVVSLPGGCYWFHFGGSAYETVLKGLFHGLAGLPALKGLAVRGRVEEARLRALAQDESRLRSVLSRFADDLVPSLSLGRYHSYLPEDVRRRVALQLFDVPGFAEWLAGRRVLDIDNATEIKKRIVEGLGIGD